MKLFSEEFLAGKNEQVKAAIFLFDHKEPITREALSKATSIDFDNLKIYLARLDKEGWVSAQSPKPYHYTLTPLGRAEIEKLYAAHLQQTSERQRKEILAREQTAKYDRGMELPEQIKKFSAFFDFYPQYMTHLLEQVRRGQFWIEVEFPDLARFCPELAELLLDDPVEVLKAWQIAIDKMHLPHDQETPFLRMDIRVGKLPSTVRLSSLGPQHIKHLIQVEASVLTVSERRPVVTSARFECPSCGNVLHVLQSEQKFKEPTSCGCGRKGKFRLLTKDLVAACTLLLVQPLTELVGKKVRPSQLKVFLKKDLTRDEIRDHMGLNSMVRVAGILHEVPIVLQSGGQSTRFDLLLEATSVQLLDHYNPQLALSPERIAQIRADVATPDFQERMINSMFPRHVGDESIKRQLMCMSVAMPLHLNSEEARRQAACEALNVLVAGDPGMGKSSLGNRMLEFCPHGGRATGAGATKAGLTIAADAKDKENDLVIPAPGAIPNANMGIFELDELDKMELTEQTVLNEALSDHTVTITKRGVNTTLPANICFIGFANPRVKEWDLSKRTFESEVNIHYTLLTRCIVNVQTDIADEAKDQAIARMILTKDQTILRPFDDEYIRDFILYVRGTVFPKLRDEDKARIETIYSQLRREVRVKFISPRFVEQLRSLTLLHAKISLRHETRKEDVDFARKTLRDALTSCGFESIALDVKEDCVITANDRDSCIKHVRAHPDGVKLLDLYAKYPSLNIKRLMETGDLVEWKPGVVRVLE